MAKLSNLSEIAIRLIKESGPEGILSSELAKILKSHRRRVYDIIAPLRALGVIKVTRSKHGSTIVWVGTASEENMEEIEKLRKENETLKEEKKALQREVATLKEEMRTGATQKKVEVSDKQVEFSTRAVRIRGKQGTLRVTNKGVEVIVEASKEGIYVIPDTIRKDATQKLTKKIRTAT